MIALGGNHELGMYVMVFDWHSNQHCDCHGRACHVPNSEVNPRMQKDKVHDSPDAILGIVPGLIRHGPKWTRGVRDLVIPGMIGF